MNGCKKAMKCIVKNKYIILSSLIFGIIFTLCSTTSPLYPFCDESHCFFTVGKAILNGQVLYKDILEQKGILIYLLQIPAYLISHKNFIGVWMIQLVLIIISSVFIFKSVYILTNSNKKSYIATVLLSVVIFTSAALASGQIVEVYVLPLFVITIYFLLVENKNKQLQERKIIIHMFIIGIIIGIVFWMKYSLCGFFIGFIATNIIFDLKNRKFLLIIKKIISLMIGFLIITIPCVLYFVINDAFLDLLNYYIINNISGYGTDISLLTTLKNYITTFITELKWNPSMMILLILSIIYILKTKKLDKKTKITLMVAILMHYIIIFSHGAMFPYYFFAFSPVLVFGVTGIVETLTILMKKNSISKNFINILLVLYTILCLIIVIIFIPCPRQFLKNPTSLAQYKFAKYMNEKYENPTSLDYGFLDGGFYTVADIVPNVWAFSKLNWNNQKMNDSQNEAIKNKQTDFVILRSLSTDDVIIPEYLEENYRFIMKNTQYRVNDKFTYYLYEKK